MISGYDYEFLQKHSYAKRILEIGTGESTEALKTGGAEIYTIDRTHRPVDGVNQYVMESEEFWKACDATGFDVYFIDANIGIGDVEEIFNRASNKFKVIFHDYTQYKNVMHINHDKGVHNYNLVLRYVYDKCHTEDLQTGGTHCALLECEKL